MRDNGFSEADIEGQFAYEDFFDRMRQALREGARDTWLGDVARPRTSSRSCSATTPS